MSSPIKRPANRLKRVLIAAISAEIITSPVLLLMDDGPPKIIAAGVWFAILALTALAIFLIGLVTTFPDR